MDRVEHPVTEPTGPGAILVKAPVQFERRALTVAIGLAGDHDWVTGIQLLPAGAAQPTAPWQPPPYAGPQAFTEREVTLGEGPLAVPGTLSLPRAARPVPGVVLLTGSGPNDADETIGRNKPFKDLAWGLASAGAAVARFEKVTRAHPDQVAADPRFTLTDEYMPAAVAAIGALRGDPAVDAGRVFVAGHSAGGTVAHASAAAEVMARQAELIDCPALTAEIPASQLPFGVPAPYWLDLRAYDPAAAAAALGRPMLIVQGARDYQVTLADDLSRWQAALAVRPDVTIKVFEADNHLFFPGNGGVRAG